ncbi:MAG TPA: hypothetical protein VJS66_03045 [Burkholderiales bacterium]|nr:hypothetical protein [Burkholderiales bacterium]
MKTFRFYSVFLAIAVWLNTAIANEPQFSTAFACGEKNENVCLAGPFDKGITVTLLKKDNSGICTAKTLGKFDYDGVDRSYTGTRLGISGACTGPFSFVVIGVDPALVHLNLGKSNASSLGRLEKQARGLLAARQKSFAPEGHIYQISDAAPKTLVAGKAVLLVYETKTDAVFGPYVLFIGDRSFVSEVDQWCTTSHNFFYIRDRLHLAYFEAGCGGGYSKALIYDLTSGTPKQIHTNAKVSSAASYQWARRN